MNYRFSKEVLLRMPVKKPKDYANDNQTFLDDQHFQAALYLASPVFFATLERQHFQSGELTEKEANTLRKYINRYCFRPTPFGLFASVSLSQWAVGPRLQNTSPPVFKTSYHADQIYQVMLGQDLLDHEFVELALYEGNPSLYRALNEYRFFRTSMDENFRQREYLLQSIAYSKLLKDLIKWSNKHRKLNEVVLHIMESAACTLTEATEYANFLVDAQLLVNCLRPNISGADYLKRLLQQLELQGNPSERSRKLSQVLYKKFTQTPVELIATQLLHDELKALIPEKYAGLQTDQLSVMLHRVTAEKTLDILYQDGLRDGIYALEVLSPKEQLPAMECFISSYQQHFNGQTLPLLAALDPETGIGYQQAAAEKNNPLLETLHIPYRIKTDTSREWTAAQSLLLKCWLRDNQGPVPVIRLRENELQELKSNEQQILGISVLFRLTSEKIFIESAGGINAPALMGRFTLADEAIREAAKNMALQIEQQNPHLIFAELLHLADPHVDNVNRRESIYSYELPVTAASTLSKGQQLELADLYVRVEQNKVILFSKKHGKPVIPRLTSAYNHSLNKLPLFRFLADLPYQYGRSNLSLDLRQYFPDQHFYPRVEFRDTVLCLATWIISGVALEELKQQNSALALRAFRRISEDICLTATFSLAEGDQQLVFSRDKDADILFFCSCLRQKTEAVLKEFLPQEEIRQYNAYLIPATPLTLPLQEGWKAADFAKSRRKYMPGSEWLYLKIYAPRPGTDRLLLRLQPLLHRKYTNGKISKWFFIRYDDHAPHIRLRMKVMPEDISEVLVAFKSKLEDRIQQHVIREYQIDIYSRELERYAAAGIVTTEDFFWASSELVLSYLKQNRYKIASTIHHFALYTILAIINEFIPGQDDQLAFLLESYRQFLPEFAEGQVKIELDKKYRELSAAIHAAMKAADRALLSGSVKAGERFVGILKEVQQNIQTENEEKLYYLRSIIHMHLNRLFTDEPRKQEMITYYLLYKFLLSVKARNKG